jgi:hypothetical protein
VADSEVLIVTEDGEYGMTETDEKGTFMFQDFEYPDSTTFMIQALSRKGSDRVELVLDAESFPKPVRAVEMENNPSLQKNDFIAKAEQRAQYDEDIRVIHLDEIEVSASRIERKQEPRLEFWANRSADYTIRREEIERMHFSFTAQYLSLVPNVKVNPTGEIGKFSIQVCALCPPPLMLVDGVQLDDLSFIPPAIVESIDVLKFASATGFGVRGAHGIVSITTRRGGEDKEIEKSTQTVFTPLGYQKPVEFYSPIYETLESKHLSVPDYRTTIFWKPDIEISDENEEAPFEFYTSDFPTTYSVVIEGLTSDGKIIRQVEKIVVNY